MAIFDYGHLPRQIRENGFLPGHITKYFGPKYVASGFWDSARSDTAEFGAFVEVNAGDSYAYEVLPVSAATTADELAVVVRDVAGAPILNAGIISGPKENVPLSLFIGSAGQKGKIVSILGEQDTAPVIGGQVFVGKGTGTTVAGAIYTTAQGIDGVDTLSATNWQFAGTKFAPTTSGDYLVEVEYVG